MDAVLTQLTDRIAVNYRNLAGVSVQAKLPGFDWQLALIDVIKALLRRCEIGPVEIAQRATVAKNKIGWIEWLTSRQAREAAADRKLVKRALRRQARLDGIDTDENLVSAICQAGAYATTETVSVWVEHLQTD